MNKRVLVQKIVEQLRNELAIYQKAARAAHAEATHEQNKAENKYDTRGLEASYLARGQSGQAAEIVRAIGQFEEMTVRQFSSQDRIDLGALVEVKNKREVAIYFIGPCGGGTEILHEKKEIVVITPSSPLGQRLIGRKKGDRLEMAAGSAHDEYHVVGIS